MRVQQFTHRPAHPERRVPNDSLDGSHQPATRMRRRRVGQCRVSEGDFRGPPPLFELPQAGILRIGSAHVQHTVTILTAPADSSPEEQVVWPQVQAICTGGAILVRQRLVPMQENCCSQALIVLVS